MESRLAIRFALHSAIRNPDSAIALLSAKTEYACLALLRLAAEHRGGKPLQGKRLAAEEGIPEGFLVQILQELKRLGLVTSIRGSTGGYRLARSPDDLSLGEALDLLDGPAERGSHLSAPTPFSEALSDLVGDAERAARDRLHAVTLAEIATSGARESMYYI